MGSHSKILGIRIPTYKYILGGHNPTQTLFLFIDSYFTQSTTITITGQIVPDLASVSSWELALMSFWHIPMILWAISYFLEQKDIPGTIFSVPGLESAISQRRNVFAKYKYAYCYWRVFISRWLYLYIAASNPGVILSFPLCIFLTAFPKTETSGSHCPHLQRPGIQEASYLRLLSLTYMYSKCILLPFYGVVGLYKKGNRE